MRALLVVLALPAAAHAELVGKGVHIGANSIGIEDSNNSTDAPFPMPGFVMGTSLRQRFTPTFSLQLEANVEQKRAHALECMQGCMVVADIGLWYVAVPVLLRFDLVPGATKFHLDAGPELVLGLGGGQTDRMSDAYERFDDLAAGNLGVAVGIGFEIPSGPGSITLAARYKRWFVPIASAGDETVELTHQIWVATGYVFP